MTEGFFWDCLSCCDDSLSIYTLFAKTFFEPEEISVKCPCSVWMCHPFIVNFYFLERKVVLLRFLK